MLITLMISLIILKEMYLKYFILGWYHTLIFHTFPRFHIWVTVSGFSTFFAFRRLVSGCHRFCKPLWVNPFGLAYIVILCCPVLESKMHLWSVQSWYKYRSAFISMSEDEKEWMPRIPTWTWTVVVFIGRFWYCCDRSKHGIWSSKNASSMFWFLLWMYL